MGHNEKLCSVLVIKAVKKLFTSFFHYFVKKVLAFLQITDIIIIVVSTRRK